MHSTSNKGDEADRFGHADRELSASSRSAAPAGTVINFQFQKPIVAAASVALEDASSSDWDVPPTIGELAVRLVADWSLPRLVVMTVTGREEP